MSTIDFRELSEHGNPGEGLENFARLLLTNLGFSATWTGRGSDQGKDLLATEVLPSLVASKSRVWLVSCKDFAKSKKSVPETELPLLENKLKQHGADGFLLITTTTASASAKAVLDGLDQRGIPTKVWDAAELGAMLISHQMRDLLKQFFPVSYKRVVELERTELPLESLAALPNEVIEQLTAILAPYAKQIRYGDALWPDDKARADAFDELLTSLSKEDPDERAIAQSVAPGHVDVVQRVLRFLHDRELPELHFEFCSQLIELNPDSDMALNCYQSLVDEDQFEEESKFKLLSLIGDANVRRLYYDDVEQFVDFELCSDPASYRFYQDIDLISSSTIVDDASLTSIDFEVMEDRVQFTGEGHLECTLVYGGIGGGAPSFPLSVEGYIDSDGIHIEDATTDTRSFYEDGDADSDDDEDLDEGPDENPD